MFGEKEKLIRSFTVVESNLTIEQHEIDIESALLHFEALDFPTRAGSKMVCSLEKFI